MSCHIIISIIVKILQKIFYIVFMFFLFFFLSSKLDLTNAITPTPTEKPHTTEAQCLAAGVSYQWCPGGGALYGTYGTCCPAFYECIEVPDPPPYNDYCKAPPGVPNPTDAPQNPPYTYTKCPAGTALSCGSVAQAKAQNKTDCLYKSTCNKYLWPSKIGNACNVNNPYQATCSWNCGCCPIGKTRVCTQGAQYLKNVTIDLTNGPPAEDYVAKIMCNTHDDIFISNVKIKDYWVGADHLQDWRLSCKVNICKCSGQTTPTPTKKPTSTPTKTPAPTSLPPLKCEQMKEFIGAVNITNNLGVIKLGDEVTFTASIKNTGRKVKSMTFQVIKDGIVIEKPTVSAVLVGSQWKASYKKVIKNEINSYGNYRVRVVAVTSL